MTIKSRIKKLIQEKYIYGDYKKLLGEKYEGDSYNNWCLKTNGKLLKSKITRDSTLGFTPSFTSFIHLNEVKNTDIHNIIYSFYLRKSSIGDFTTCYGIIRTILILGDEKIHYPNMFVASPIGPYRALFKEGWELLTQAYPESVYLPFRYLTNKIDEFTLPGEKESTVYDLVFGQHAGRPLIISGDIYYNPSLD